MYWCANIHTVLYTLKVRAFGSDLSDMETVLSPEKDKVVIGHSVPD